MYKYSFQVILDYEYKQRNDFPRKIKYNYEKLEYDDENTKTHIHLKEGFNLIVSNVLARSRDEAFSLACIVIQKVCKVITLLLQNQNYDNRESCPHLYFFPYNVKMISEEIIDEEKEIVITENGLHLMEDSIILHDGIGMINISQGLDLSSFDKIYGSMDCDGFIDIIEIIYRAVLSPNVESRYFQLFTIIEAIETKYGNDADISHKIINSDNVDVSVQKLISVCSATA